MIKENILAALRGEYGARELPPVGTVCDDIYKVILCPVCGHKTLDNYDICRRCGWEYDGASPERYSTANGTTLAAYREEYRKAVQETEGKENA